MCGRIICALNPEDFLHLTKNEKVLNSSKFRKSYNICPERFLPGFYISQKNKENFQEENFDNEETDESQELSLFDEKEKKGNGKIEEKIKIFSEVKNLENCVLDIMKWGTTNSKGFKVINARSETSDIYFKNLEKCVMVVQGFYEWKTNISESGVETKKPYFFKRTNPKKDYLFIAGKYKNKNKFSLNKDEKNENENSDIKEFLILTQEASNKTSEIHHRMPLILNEETIKEYLTCDFSIEEYKEILNERGFDFDKEIEFYPVGDLVNNLNNQSKDNILPFEEVKYAKDKTWKISKFFEAKKENFKEKDEKKIDLIEDFPRSEKISYKKKASEYKEKEIINTDKGKKTKKIDAKSNFDKGKNINKKIIQFKNIENFFPKKDQ